MRLDDVLARRTRIAFEAGDNGLRAAPRAAALMAPELGWDNARVRREIAHYRQAVAAELAARDQPDDKLAVEARMQADDPARFYQGAGG
jgi:glycerol-3-phosphate dehydrogenase